MDPFDTAASGFQRRSSTREPRRSDSARSDDDYDLSAFAIADGFRPTQPSPGPDIAQHDPSIPLPPTTQPSPPAAFAPTKTTSDSDRPSSASKPPPSHDSLTLRNDGSSSARRRHPDAPVSSGLATGDALMQSERPYRGPLGPSHPYSMYPQRTFSTATSSTAPNSNRQSYVGPRGPTHPYALYTQTTAAGEDTTQEDIPVGFTGMGNAYQRQLGPDGEEAGDLIGPLGHMEELPPYTRYPEDSLARRKSPEPTNDMPPTSAEAATGAQPIPGAGGLGIATRNPEFSSTEDDLPALSRSRPTSRSERRARKKLWGIVPYWAIALLAVGIVIVGVVLGTVIGTVLAKNDNAAPHPDRELDSTPMAATTDVQPLKSVPPNLAPLAVGAYSLPPLDTSQAPKSCFLNPTQAQAWSCDIPFRFYSMNVAAVPNAPDTKNYELTLSAINASNSKFIWGAQPPNVPDPQPLTLVTDAFEEGRGPAWWLKVTYEKTVIVAEDKFPGPDGGGPGLPPKFKRKNIGAKDGDKPWICTWPDTTLEIFIYPSQNVSIPTASRSRTASPTMATDIADATPDDGPVPMPAYPKVVKFLERRWCDDPSAAARCRQVVIKEGGREKEDLKDQNGNIIETVIMENWKNPSEQIAQRERERHAFGKRSYPNEILSREVLELTDCGCLWWST
ncbi:proteinrelated to glucan 1, 4-alpha-glucosidase [Hirsutella rhossiliensis]|uniref:Proteinrelated to glucan 1, 4-alpha-glucosidase n=1 Tax=Hirsutella rhossiliensis TaxID=111463 RepID=A0A9P8MNQ5_9HYPO|nr:proteinrelated to glucan 1, 4-alpha-glucosidase [Hirsutella rhossiliensis]KAH0958622.1 proteinrelated to glucan 1, 4-alpha-glucosidase [Hirsutella rhossiliensis]